MKQYDSYKDSGVEWIGEVPSHWEVMKTSLAFHGIGSGTTPSTSKKEFYDDNDGYYWLQTGDLNDGLINDTSKKITKLAISQCNLKFYPIDSIVIAMYGATIGKVGIFGIKTATNQACCVLPANKNMNSKFAFYEFLACKPALLVSAIGGGQPNISQDVIRKQKIAIPPLLEQNIIATYLDNKCSEIDNVISAQQKRIALLQELKQSVITHAVTKGLNPNVEMKDSGVEWIGKVPKHWEICKLKHVSSLYGRIGFRGYNQTDLVSEGEGAITLSPSNMQNGTMDYNKCSFLSWKKYYESPEIMIKDGDILFVKTGSTYGKTSLVNKLPMEATINPQIVVFKDIKVNNHFLYYLLTNDIVQMQVSLTVSGSTIPTLSQDNILNYVIPIAPKNEQDEIANYLDKKCESIDSSISKAQHQVELLQEYKQSLITEVVTGKRKVS